MNLADLIPRAFELAPTPFLRRTRSLSIAKPSQLNLINPAGKLPLKPTKTNPPHAPNRLDQRHIKYTPAAAG